VRRSKEAYARLQRAAGFAEEVHRGRVTDVDSLHRLYKTVYVTTSTGVREYGYAWGWPWGPDMLPGASPPAPAAAA
jgi:hypothetical protein